MSLVTNVLLVTGLEYDEVKERIAAFPGDGRPGLLQVDVHAGGTKHMECDVWAAGFNYLEDEALLAHIRAIPWDWPERVQLFWRHQDEDRFTEVELGGVRR